MPDSKELIADVLFSTGNLTLPYATEGAGLWPFAHDVLSIDCDSRTEYRFFQIPFNAENLDFFGKRMLMKRAKYRVIAFHSHGSRICRAMSNILSRGYPDQMIEGGLGFEMAWGIDPVPYMDEASIPEMVTPTDKPWKLPPNVRHAIGFQTRNWRLGMPFGRKLAPASGVDTKIRQIYFDRDTENYDGDLCERWIKDASCDHTNIDNHPETWAEMRRGLQNLIIYGPDLFPVKAEDVKVN